MYLKLRIRNDDPFPVKCLLYRLLHGIVKIPVLLLPAPELCHQGNGAVLQLPYRNNGDRLL